MSILVEWENKRASLFRLFNADSFPQLVNGVLAGVDLEEEFAREKLTDTMHRWVSGVRPRTKFAAVFFYHVAQKLGCDERVSPAMLMQSSFDEFVKLLPEEQHLDALGLNVLLPQDSMYENLSELEVAKLDDRVLASLEMATFPIEVFEFEMGRHPSVHEAAAKGSIDQRLFYQHPDCAQYWEDIIIAQQYPTFDKCKFSLDKLWRSETFQTVIREDYPKNIVMLGGGGAFSKDVSAISSFLLSKSYTTQSPLVFTLLDVSSWMLRRSRLRLALNWRNTDWRDRVVIDLIAGDFMNFYSREHRLRLRRKGGPILWTLAGGTIGNLSEGEFLRSLNRVSEAGDLLVLSASLQHPTAPAVVDEQISADRYLGPAVKALLKNPIQDLMNQLGARASVDQVLSGLAPQIRTGVVPGITDVPKSHSLVMTAKINGDQYDVFNHTHYEPASLIDFVEANRWKHLETVYPDYHEPDFAQFLFRKE